METYSTRTLFCRESSIVSGLLHLVGVIFSIIGTLAVLIKGFFDRSTNNVDTIKLLKEKKW